MDNNATIDSIADLIGYTLSKYLETRCQTFLDDNCNENGDAGTKILPCLTSGMPAPNWTLPTGKQICITPVRNFFVDETEQIDHVGLFNDSTTEDTVGILTSTSITGLGMNTGVTYGYRNNGAFLVLK